ncbi:hypothetical protein T05_3614 [Trichinella murrelli]|uniref:Uncharacterized protein n=1 Tax=Trichinella murrelli TaxID=144512 RepID=A0A0V0SVA2_9BILA|nr:hypothetical protein T05_3614 [Trichinella murrelli]
MQIGTPESHSKWAASPPQSLPYTVRKAIEQIGTATSTERSEASKDEKHIYRICVFCGRKRDKKHFPIKVDQQLYYVNFVEFFS